MVLCQESLREVSQDEEFLEQKPMRINLNISDEKGKVTCPVKETFSRKSSNVSNPGAKSDNVPVIKIETTFPVESDTPIQCRTNSSLGVLGTQTSKKEPTKQNVEKSTAHITFTTTIPTNIKKVSDFNLNPISGKEPEKTKSKEKEPSYRSKKDPQKEINRKTEQNVLPPKASNFVAIVSDST